VTIDDEKFEFSISDRKSLQNLRNIADWNSRNVSLGGNWKRAYEKLADAADHLDALWARTEVR